MLVLGCSKRHYPQCMSVFAIAKFERYLSVTGIKCAMSNNMRLLRSWMASFRHAHSLLVAHSLSRYLGHNYDRSRPRSNGHSGRV